MSKKLKQFNIETFFPNNLDETKLNYHNGKFDVDTLFKPLFEKETLTVLDKSELLDTIIKKKSRLKKYYTQYYNNCCSKIKSANKYSITDIIFDIPEFISECPDYNPGECIRFIKKNLSGQLFNTYIISPMQIFITWHDIMDTMDSQTQI